MTYVLPKDVRTPRKNVKGVHVLYDGAEESFSIAVLNWADESGKTVEKLGPLLHQLFGKKLCYFCSVSVAMYCIS